MNDLSDTFNALFNPGPECIYCGKPGKDDEMVPTVRTNGEPSHFAHKTCKAQRDAERKAEAEQREADFQRDMQLDELLHPDPDKE